MFFLKSQSDFGINLRLKNMMKFELKTSCYHFILIYIYLLKMWLNFGGSNQIQLKPYQQYKARTT